MFCGIDIVHRYSCTGGIGLGGACWLAATGCRGGGHRFLSRRCLRCRSSPPLHCHRFLAASLSHASRASRVSLAHLPSSDAVRAFSAFSHIPCLPCLLHSHASPAHLAIIAFPPLPCLLCSTPHLPCPASLASSHPIPCLRASSPLSLACSYSSIAVHALPLAYACFVLCCVVFCCVAIAPPPARTGAPRPA